MVWVDSRFAAPHLVPSPPFQGAGQALSSEVGRVRQSRAWEAMSLGDTWMKEGSGVLLVPESLKVWS